MSARLQVYRCRCTKLGVRLSKLVMEVLLLVNSGFGNMLRAFSGEGPFGLAHLRGCKNQPLVLCWAVCGPARDRPED